MSRIWNRTAALLLTYNELHGNLQKEPSRIFDGLNCRNSFFFLSGDTSFFSFGRRFSDCGETREASVLWTLEWDLKNVSGSSELRKRGGIFCGGI